MITPETFPIGLTSVCKEDVMLSVLQMTAGAAITIRLADVIRAKGLAGGCSRYLGKLSEKVLLIYSHA